MFIKGNRGRYSGEQVQRPVVAGGEIRGKQSSAYVLINKHGRAYYCGRTGILSRAGGSDHLYSTMDRCNIVTDHFSWMIL